MIIMDYRCNIDLVLKNNRLQIRLNKSSSVDVFHLHLGVRDELQHLEPFLNVIPGVFLLKHYFYCYADG